MLENESLSMISLPDLSFPEINTIPLTCWQDVCLSKIWIPSHLLKSRRKPSNTWETQGVFRTLEKRGHEKQIESFSVYSDSDNEGESDVFQSDSDDAFDIDSISSEKTKTKDDSQKCIEKDENLTADKSFPKESNISLNEILNSTTEVDITNFELKKDHRHASKLVDTLQSNKKKKNSKKKNKTNKSITLDRFLEDYTEEDRQEDYANDYLQKLIIFQNKGSAEDNQVQLKNNLEFPELISNEIEFMHSEKSTVEKTDTTIKTLAEILSEHDKNEKISGSHAMASDSEPAIGKIVIENIPSEISDEDIFTVLFGYGDIIKFSLKPELDGNFKKAFVEINLTCDIDWIIECLNGTEPFGTSSRVLKCYKQ